MARRLVRRESRERHSCWRRCAVSGSYAAAALTETLEIFFTALAIDCAIAGLQNLEERRMRLGWDADLDRRRDPVASDGVCF